MRLVAIALTIFLAPILSALFRVPYWLTVGIAAFGFIAVVLGMPMAICGPDFLLHFNADGRCAASDTPNEVFFSFLMIGVFFSGLSLMLATCVERARR